MEAHFIRVRIQKFLGLTLPIALVLMIVFMMMTEVRGHMRGPHHPRSTPVASHSSNQNHQHHHYVPRGSPSGEPAPILTHDKKLLHDTEHLKEDMGDWIVEDGKELSPEEMEFHYFKMHDYDNNSMLDGLEILQAISHILPMTEMDGEEAAATIDLTSPRSHTHNSHSTSENAIPRKLTKEEAIQQRQEDFDYYIDLIDKVLAEDDMNKDGYLSYFEYVVGRRREEKNEKALHSSNSNP